MIKSKKELKISNETSNVVSKESPSNELVEQAKQIHSKHQEYKQRAWDLGTEFKQIIEDRTLPENKSVIVKDLENEVMGQLNILASEMNADEAQPEGMGAIALCHLLMKILLLQRDRINNLEFALNEQNKKILKLSQNDK